MYSNHTNPDMMTLFLSDSACGEPLPLSKFSQFSAFLLPYKVSNLTVMDHKYAGIEKHKLAETGLRC